MTRTFPLQFPAEFRDELAVLIRWRRDVRSFASEPVTAAAMDAIKQSFALAPSVGLSQPWRIVNVVQPHRRAAVIANFESANAAALADQSPDRAEDYAHLKLAGLRSAEHHWAVFCEPDPTQGHTLGRRTMPEMVHASVVCAIMQLWLTARAWGVGVGWVSILDAQQLNRDLDVDHDWDLIAYLCIGRPAEIHDTPELERHGWDHRRSFDTHFIQR